MRKISLTLISLVVIAGMVNGQNPSNNNTLGNSGITSIASTTNASYKLSINGAVKQYGTGFNSVTSPTLFLQNTTASTGRQYGINSENGGLFQIVDITASNATRFVINGSGNIGIGTTNPTQKFHVNGTVKLEGLQNDDLLTRIIVSDGSGQLYWRNASSLGGGGSSQWNTVGSNIHYSAGNVGINTSSPSYKLQVTEPAANTPAAVFEGGGGSAIMRVRPISGGGAVDIGFTGTGQDMWLVGTNVTSGFRIVGSSSPLHLETILADPMRFKTSSIERMIIDGSGNVGIGTSNPTSKFELNGDSYFSAYQSTMKLNGVKLQWRGSDALLNGFQGYDGTLEIQGVNDLKQTIYNGTMYLRAQNFSNIKFQTTDNNTDRLVIQNDGNIGIGTSSPTNKFHVNGSVKLEGLGTENGYAKILAADGSGNLAFREASTLGGGGGSSQWTTSGNNIYNNNSGNVGVGITNPAHLFHAAPVQYSAGTASQSGATVTGSGTIWTEDMKTNYLVFADGTRRTITDFINPTTLTVAESGTVSSQIYKIHHGGLGVEANGRTTISTAAWVDDLLTVKSGIGTWGAGVAKFESISPYASGGYNTIVCAFAPNVDPGSNINAYQFGLRRGSLNNSATWLFKYMGDMSSSNYVALRYWDQPQEVVRFRPNGVTEFEGNVGIGTTNPTNKLHINGSVKLEGLGTQNEYTKILAADGTGSLAWRDASTLGGSGGSSQWNPSGNNIYNNNDGVVFIGTPSYTPSPADADLKLAVKGNIYTKRVKVTSVNWADYVFYPKYPLLPLKDLESFINKNKHLPDVPSAAEVEANGLDLGENQATLLKKIEELTLYIIDINKKVDKLVEENASLKKKLDNTKKQ